MKCPSASILVRLTMGLPVTDIGPRQATKGSDVLPFDCGWYSKIVMALQIS